MASVTTAQRIGPEDAGRLMSPEDFDAIDDYEDGWRYELIRGVLVVSPIPRKPSRGMAVKLTHWLESYCDREQKGEDYLVALFEEEVRLPCGNRRRCDVAIWIGFGRNPRADDIPTITVEFVSKRKADIRRDYVDKQADYLAAGVREYWIVDRFQRSMTVFRRKGRRWVRHVVNAGETYSTPLLPGFQLDLAKLLARADALSRKD